MRQRLWTVIVLALFVLPARAAGAQAGGPRFEPAPCPYVDYVIPVGERVECGYVTVPENRARPGGATIRLPVALLYALLWLAAALSAAALVCAVLAWQRRWWTASARMYYTLVALAGAGFVVVLVGWGLMGCG